MIVFCVISLLITISLAIYCIFREYGEIDVYCTKTAVSCTKGKLQASPHISSDK